MKHTGLLFFFFLLVQSICVDAQVFPVQGNAVLIPPYSVYLSDYTTRSNDRFVLNVVLANETRPELPVRLRLKIEGKNIRIETKPEFIGSQIVLQGRVPMRLSGIDLMEYFNPDNLNFSGITQKEFEKTGALPQGFYQFCFEVLEYNRGIKISNTICAPGWLILNDPPLVNIPRNNEKLRPTIPQNVVFQWTPRHTGSPNSAFTTEYELKMVEVWPDNRNPNDAIFTSPPILETTTRATNFIYGPAETPLEAGRRYAFRVQAKSIVGVEEYDLFKNNGYSEVYTFVYGDVCEVPLNISAQAIGSSGFHATWDARFNHTSYQIHFREANKSNAEWFTSSAVLNEVSVNSLKSNTLYEYQVSGACGPFESPFTQVATIRTNFPPVAEYSCGLPMQAFSLDPSTLVASLEVGDVIQAGDFQVELVRITGGNGTFSGEGTVVVPFLNNVKVKAKFTDILVNQQNRVVKGYLNVTGAALDIIPDQVTVLIDDLNQTLDEIEEGLNKAEDITGQVDAALDQVTNVVNQVAAYLPDDILREINDAKQQIATARTDMKNAATTEAKEEAKVEVKQGRDKLKDAAGRALAHYAKTVGDLLKLLKEVFNQLHANSKVAIGELKVDKSQTESEFTAARGQVLAHRDGVTLGDGQTATADVVYALAPGTQSENLTTAELEELKKDPRIKAYIEKLSAMTRIVMLLHANEKMQEVITRIINNDNVLQGYVKILQDKATQEDEAFRQAIKEGRLNSLEIKNKVISIIQESLVQDYLNSEK